MSEISFWLDYYDDIYSDFDSRKYHKRRLSEDFVDEIKNSLKYRANHIHDLLLLLPAQERKPEIESDIINNMKTQFQQRYESFAKTEKKVFKRGVLLLISGLLIMFIASFITFKGYDNFGITVLRFLSEPASWFMVWTGLDALLYDYRQAKKETAFYKFTTQLEIHFKDL